MTARQPFRCLGLGEVLWDLLPDGRQLGGAPANFAYHARALGADAAVITRIGDDDLGREILRRFEVLGLPADLVQRDPAAPTGTVTVELDAEGVPQFTIHENVAWDRLEVTGAALAAAAGADAVCFGTLGQRCPGAQQSIERLLEATRPDALRIFDINLRQHFHSREVIERSLARARVLKLNDGELPVLAALFDLAGPVEAQVRELARRHDLDVVALTRGAEGSLLFGGGGFVEEPGQPVAVQDTVGAGDAFTAALAVGLLQRRPLAEVNRLANAVARHVCTCAGATPPLPEALRRTFGAA